MMAIGLRNKRRLLTIDWDKKDLRLAVVRPKGSGVELLKAVSVPIPRDVVTEDAESLGAFLREAMRQSNIGAKSAIMNIPREQVVLNTLNLPPTPPEELPALVQFQIVKELPFSAEQATIDFVCGQHDPKSACTALVAAVRHEDIEFYRKTAKEAGLSIERIGLRPYANLLAVRANMPDMRDKSLLVVEIGPHLTEIDVVQAGALTFSRAASVPLPDFERTTGNITDSRITAAPIQNLESDESSRKAVEQLMVDVIRSVEAYRATAPSVTIDQVIVCGASGIEAELAESLAARFAVRAQLFSPDRALDLTPQRAKELRGFSAVIGLALGQGQEKLETFDFLNPKKPVSKRSLRLKKAPTAILTAAFLIAAGLTFHYKFVKPEQDKAEALNREIQKFQTRQKPINAFANEVTALEDWVKSEQYWPEVLVALTKAFPSEREAYVTRLEFESRAERKSSERTSHVMLKLRNEKLGTVNQHADALRDRGFDNVVPGGDTPSETNDHYHFDTKVDADIPLRSELERDLPVVEDESPEEPDDESEGTDEAATPDEAASDETGDVVTESSDSEDEEEARP